MKKAFIIMAQIMFLSSTASASETRTFGFEVFTGSAYSFQTPLKINQDGHEEISLTAEYETKPFEGAPYYAIRAGVWGEDKGWELELIHHKLYLDNNPPEVDHFEITHGYNLLMLIRGWKTNWKGQEYIIRAGAGLTLVHPEFTVRGEEMEEIHTFKSSFGGEFYHAGYSAQASVGRRFYFSDRVYGALEAKFTASTADIKMEDGNAVDAPNVAFHLLFGLGYDYKRPGK